jgi:hypothetical protein
MSAANPNPMEKSMVSMLVVENAGGGSPLPCVEVILHSQSCITEYGLDLSNIGSAEEAICAANNITDIIHKATDAAVPWIKQRAKQAP